jgi:Ca-activated chloride channel family protein
VTLPYFDRPWLLALALLLPAAAVILLVGAQRGRRRRLRRLGSEDMVRRLVPPAALGGVGWRAARLAAAAACAAVAFAGPRWGSERTIVRGSGIDMVLALDASLSMLATDERPSRLEKMKQEVRRLRSMSAGDRVGLIAFAGRSYILTPLTVDDGALDLFLDNLDPSVVGQAGSSLARAIRQSIDLLLTTETASDRAVVIMSDGEAFEPREEVEQEAARAVEQGIALVTVGFGTVRGSTIPVRSGDSVTVKRDDSGNVVITQYSPDMLRAAAQAAHGTFIDAAETDKATKVRRALASLRAQQRATVTGEDRTPRFQLFLIPALLLLAADTVLAERRGRRRRPSPAAATPPAAAAALVLALLVPRPALADDAGDAAAAYKAGRYAQAAALYRRVVEHGDRSPVALYNLATALLAADSLAPAAELLERVAAVSMKPDDAELRYRALFNLGLAHLKRGLAAEGEAANEPLDAALASYKKVLLMRSRDGDAKWNYELALRKRKSGGGGGGGGGAGQQPQANQPTPTPAPQAPIPRPSGGLGQRQAEQLLNSAAREERDTQARRLKQNQPEPPPGAKDW